MDPYVAQKFPPPSAPSVYDQPPPTGIPVLPPNYNHVHNFQPPPPHAHAGAPGEWSTGLFDCFSDVSNSCEASGALYALIAFVTGCPCMYSCFYRSKMRRQYMLPEDPCEDCLVHFCCESCALCQQYRELKNRGFDMSLGWDGNVERQNPAMTMAPAVQGGMSR